MPLHPMPDMAMMLTGTGQVRDYHNGQSAKEQWNEPQQRKKTTPKSNWENEWSKYEKNQNDGYNGSFGHDGGEESFTFTMSTTG
ncbi:MAG: hypothetical protein ACLTXT_04825 [Ruminococcus callidus]